MTSHSSHSSHSSRATLSADYQRNWPAYFDAIATQPPRDTCLRALAALVECVRTSDDQPVAFDLGCGEGRDTRAILSSYDRLRVLAIDASPEGLRRLSATLGPSAPRVQTIECSLEGLPTLHASNATLPRHALLVNASFALPFCHEESFPDLWTWIRRLLSGSNTRPSGLFAGQLFGDRDEWVATNPRRHVSRSQLDALLLGWTILHLDEVEKEGSDAMGGTKHHHVFHVVARAD